MMVREKCEGSLCSRLLLTGVPHSVRWASSSTKTHWDTTHVLVEGAWVVLLTWHTFIQYICWTHWSSSQCLSGFQQSGRGSSKHVLKTAGFVPLDSFCYCSDRTLPWFIALASAVGWWYYLGMELPYGSLSTVYCFVIYCGTWPNHWPQFSMTNHGSRLKLLHEETWKDNVFVSLSFRFWQALNPSFPTFLLTNVLTLTGWEDADIKALVCHDVLLWICHRGDCGRRSCYHGA